MNDALPYYPVKRWRNSNRFTAQSTGGRKNILIIEDEPEFRFLLKTILQNDYIISESEDGETAISFLEKITPDLIISDVVLPHMDGLELCNKVKNTTATCHIPFIMLSARGTLDQHMAGYEAGADAYIDKPFHTPHLRMRIRKILEQSENQHRYYKNGGLPDTESEDKLPAPEKEFLDKVSMMIEENMDDTDFHAGQIEKEFFLSKMQLYRKLKSLTGNSPGEFIKYIRLQRAAHLLISTRLTVSEIFFRTGFNNQSYFFREFRKRYLASPKEYRDSQ